METMSAGAQGGCGPLYYHVLPRLINQFDLKVGAEIGVCLGGHSEAMLQLTKLERLYSVDPYIYALGSTDGHVLPNGKGFDQLEYDAMYEYTKDRLAPFSMIGRNVLIRMTSVEAALVVTEPLDFIFIDAIHKYENVLEDVFFWGNKVKEGGLICGHDYMHPSFPGVTRAVQHQFSDREIHVEPGYVWWVKK